MYNLFFEEKKNLPNIVLRVTVVFPVMKGINELKRFHVFAMHGHGVKKSGNVKKLRTRRKRDSAEYSTLTYL